MPTIATSDGVRLNYHDEGDGPPVVLVAGFQAPAMSWRYQREALAGHPWVRAEVMPACGHAADTEQPDAFTRIVTDVPRTLP